MTHFQSYEPNDSSNRSNVSAILSLLCMSLFFGGTSLSLIFLIQTDNELLKGIAIANAPFSLFGWIYFLRRALAEFELTIWSLPTTKASLVMGLVALAGALAYYWSGANGSIAIALAIGSVGYLICLLIFNFRYTRSTLVTIDLCILQLTMSVLIVVFLVWIWIRFSKPPRPTEPVY
jgi:hypothetical protein